MNTIYILQFVVLFFKEVNVKVIDILKVHVSLCTLIAELFILIKSICEINLELYLISTQKIIAY